MRRLPQSVFWLSDFFSAAIRWITRFFVMTPELGGATVVEKHTRKSAGSSGYVGATILLPEVAQALNVRATKALTVSVFKRVHIGVQLVDLGVE